DLDDKQEKRSKDLDDKIETLSKDLRNEVEGVGVELSFMTSANRYIAEREDIARPTEGRSKKPGPFSRYGGVQDNYHSHLTRY
ncbi:hypothetical protein, partial [Marinibactrum halimedae]